MSTQQVRRLHIPTDSNLQPSTLEREAVNTVSRSTCLEIWKFSVIRLIFLLVLLFIFPKRACPSSYWIGNSLVTCYKDEEQGHSLPEQEYKGIHRPPPRKVADTMTQGQQQLKTLLQGKRRPNKSRSETIGPTFTVYCTYYCANDWKQCSEWYQQAHKQGKKSFWRDPAK